MGDRPRPRAGSRGGWLGCAGLAVWAVHGALAPLLAPAQPPPPGVGDPGAPAPDTARRGAGAIALDITSSMGDGQTFREGDPLSFLVSSDRAAHLVLILEDADETLVRLVPNRRVPDDLPSGLYTEIPDPASPERWRVGPPFGRVRVWAFAASTPFPDLPGTWREDGTVRLSGSLDQVLARLRAHGARPDVAFGEAVTTLTTVPKGRSSEGL